MKLNDMNFGSLKSEIAIRKTEVQAPQSSVLKKLGGVYDEHAKLVFCFDVSGSMEERVTADKSGKSLTDQFKWPAAKLASIRQMVEEAVNEINNPMTISFSYETERCMKMIDPTATPDGWVKFTATDEDIKTRVIQHDLIDFFGIAVDWSKPHLQPPTRIGLVQKLAKREIEARFAKYPQSKMAVVAFGDGAKVVFDDGSLDDVRQVCDRIATGMDGVSSNETNIMAALKQSIECCRKHPSPVGLHHFIVVSDGQDGGTCVLPEWVPVLKASGVVLDYIHIGNSYVNDALKAACAALGGEFVVVNTEKDFETKFVEAVHRLMIPAPAGM